MIYNNRRYKETLIYYKFIKYVLKTLMLEMYNIIHQVNIMYNVTINI